MYGPARAARLRQVKPARGPGVARLSAGRADRLRFADLPRWGNSMSRRHAHLLRAIFHDPPSGNIHWREVESLLGHVGAALESLSGARIRVRLGQTEGILHRPHHSNVLDASSIQHVRQILARGGVTPSQYEHRDDDAG
jgi:hypothetical protein